MRTRMLTGAVGCKFARALKRDTELQESYKEASGREAKASFRTKWATQQLAAAERHAVKRQQHSTQEKLQGTYVPFKKLWEHEGDDASGYAAAHIQSINRTPASHMVWGMCCAPSFVFSHGLGLGWGGAGKQLPQSTYTLP
jgi:hypothetical protein